MFNITTYNTNDYCFIYTVWLAIPGFYQHVLLVITTVILALAFTLAEGWTSGSSTVAFVPSCTYTRCSHGASEWHLPLKSSSDAKLVVMHWYHLCAIPTHWSQELNAGLSNIMPVETSLLYRSPYMLDQCVLVRLNATYIQLWKGGALHPLIYMNMTKHSRRCIWTDSTMKNPGSCVRATCPKVRSGMLVHAVYALFLPHPSKCDVVPHSRSGYSITAYRPCQPWTYMCCWKRTVSMCSPHCSRSRYSSHALCLENYQIADFCELLPCCWCVRTFKIFSSG